MRLVGPRVRVVLFLLLTFVLVLVIVMGLALFIVGLCSEIFSGWLLGLIAIVVLLSLAVVAAQDAFHKFVFGHGLFSLVYTVRSGDLREYFELRQGGTPLEQSRRHFQKKFGEER